MHPPKIDDMLSYEHLSFTKHVSPLQPRTEWIAENAHSHARIPLLTQGSASPVWLNGEVSGGRHFEFMHDKHEYSVISNFHYDFWNLIIIKNSRLIFRNLPRRTWMIVCQSAPQSTAAPHRSVGGCHTFLLRRLTKQVSNLKTWRPAHGERT